MSVSYFEWAKLALLLCIAGLLAEILRFVKIIWSKIFDIHIVIVRKDDPKRYGGAG